MREERNDVCRSHRLAANEGPKIKSSHLDGHAAMPVRWLDCHREAAACEGLEGFEGRGEKGDSVERRQCTSVDHLQKLQLPSYQLIGLIDAVIETPNRRRHLRTWEELTRSASACDAPRQLTSDSSTELCPELHDIPYNYPPLAVHPRGLRSTRSRSVIIWACPKILDY